MNEGKPTAEINPLPSASRLELAKFWQSHPQLREMCLKKYGFDPVSDADAYWRYGIAEPDHKDLLALIRLNGGEFTLPLVKAWEMQELEAAAIQKEGKKQKAVTAAGMAVRAKDTGRVLMLQRAHSPNDLAAGTWEFPGGRLNEGEHPHVGAKREWQEEMGVRLPKGNHVGGWRSGIYEGFIHEVPTENSVRLNADPEDRQYKDPDGDSAEVAAWFHPDQLRRMSGLRPELRESRPWRRVKKELTWQDMIMKKIEEDEDDDLEKETAPGGEIPQSTDIADITPMPTQQTLRGVGPTINEVHITTPLKNLSVSYAGKQKKLRVTKADQYKQLIYGVVLEPNSLDSQDDYMLSDHVEKAAHTYMRKVVRGKASVSKLQHRAPGFFKEKASVIPVESFVAPCDFSYDGKETVKKGTWVIVLHIEDTNVWRDVMDGKYNGLSIGGTGIRQEMKMPVPGGEMRDEPAEWFGKAADRGDLINEILSIEY